jgi:hypothetical protein
MGAAAIAATVTCVTFIEGLPLRFT